MLATDRLQFMGRDGLHTNYGIFMYLPVYRSGTERVAEWRRKNAAGRVLPALYGCRGLVDIETVEEAMGGGK